MNKDEETVAGPWCPISARMWNGFGKLSEVEALDICVHLCKNWFVILSHMILKLVYINRRTKRWDPARTGHDPSWNRSRYSLNITSLNHLRKLSMVYHLETIKCIINECYSSKYNIGYLAFNRGSNHRMTRRYWFCLCRYTRIIWFIYHILKIIGLKSLYIHVQFRW